MGPIKLARALQAKGVVRQADGSTLSLQDACGITENTQSVLCRIADDIRLLTRLQTVNVPDVPNIFACGAVREGVRQDLDGPVSGRAESSNPHDGAKTRRLPLVIDQPRRTGYSYVVHLIVPKTLEVKSSRQLLIISHNANVPVLGDADYVLKLENVPQEGGGRRCIVQRALFRM